MAYYVIVFIVASVLASSPVVLSVLHFSSLAEDNLSVLKSCPANEKGRVHTDLFDIIHNLTVVPQCGDGLWYRAAYLNMADSSQNCPDAWREITDPVRACGRTDGVNCSSHFFPTKSLQYGKICGRVTGFQNGSTDAFANFHTGVNSSTATADDTYVDGLSITHGSQPRHHIWTFASGNTDGTLIDVRANCPCVHINGDSPPTFVRDHYFCESGNGGRGLGRERTGNFFTDDPLWDGELCEGECCSNGRSPPWFNVELSYSTSDDIEVRICGDENILNEDVPVQLLEIYIQ